MFEDMLGISNVYTLPHVSLLPYTRPLSQHPTGFMVAFCDGHTRFVSESIGYDTYSRLMTHKGKKYQPAGASSLPPSYALIRQMQMSPVTDDQF
jgi:prepilin-type processing-associated H-X9-DG protein